MKTGLYPLSLFCKVDERKSINANIAIVPLASDMKKKEKRKNEKLSEKELPIIIDDGQTLPIALLAKTYVREGLSTVERYHAKCGDVGIKYLKRAFPKLTIPKLFRP